MAVKYLEVGICLVQMGSLNPASQAFLIAVRDSSTFFIAAKTHAVL
jgi:hypothetical protein